MSQQVNRYAEERGLHRSDSHFREEAREVITPSPPSPFPGTESVGPSLFDLVQRTERSIEVQNQLLRAAIPLLNIRKIVSKTNGQTDANGKLDLVLYRVPQGMQFVTTRVNIEDASHTPASPFSNAAGWIALIAADKFQPGTIRDFAPNPPLSNGPIIPFQFSDGNTEAALFRGGEAIGLHVDGTAALANIDIWVTLQGIEEPL